MKISPVILVILTVYCLCGFAFEPGDLITESDLRSHIYFLASQELEGREAGCRGSEVTARYIASRFAGLGLEEPPGAPGYYQQVPLILMRPDFSNTALTVTAGGRSTTSQTDKEVFFFPRGGDDADITAPVVLCGYGITAPEYDYDDYKGVDVSGKIVLVMNHEPQENDSSSVFNGIGRTKYSINIVKAKNARQHGAKALLIMRAPVEQLPIDQPLKKYRKELEKPIFQLPGETETLPVFYLTDEVADALLKGRIDLKKYHNRIDRKLKGAPKKLKDVSVSLRIRFMDREEKESPNVAGLLRGEGELSDELVIIGAHYDHIGVGPEGVFVGADDNASGVAALLELAEALTKSDERPRRSILFISFAAEEKGALGSLYYTKNPLYPMENTISMINMDEIGRNGASTYRGMRDPDREEKGENYLMAMYSAQTPAFEKIITRANDEVKLEIDYDPNVNFYGSSDHYNFHWKGIPTIFFFTGFQPDYHTVADTPDKINYPKLTRITRLIYEVSREIANSPDRLMFDSSIKSVSKKKRMSF